MLLAVPHGRDSFDFLQQQNSLRNGIINYLIMKQAAGIVNVSAPGTHQVSEVTSESSFLVSCKKNHRFITWLTLLLFWFRSYVDLFFAAYCLVLGSLYHTWNRLMVVCLFFYIKRINKYIK